MRCTDSRVPLKPRPHPSARRPFQPSQLTALGPRKPLITEHGGQAETPQLISPPERPYRRRGERRGGKLLDRARSHVRGRGRTEGTHTPREVSSEFLLEGRFLPLDHPEFRELSRGEPGRRVQLLWILMVNVGDSCTPDANGARDFGLRRLGPRWKAARRGQSAAEFWCVVLFDLGIAEDLVQECP